MLFHPLGRMASRDWRLGGEAELTDRNLYGTVGLGLCAAIQPG